MRRATIPFLTAIVAMFACGDNNIKAPTVDGLTPERGPLAGGTQVTITGENLEGDIRVSFGDRLATNIVRLDNETLLVDTPAGELAVAVNVIVFNQEGSVVAPGTFSYNPLPTVTEIVPDRGSHRGFSVSLLGTGFLDLEAGDNSVLFDDVPCEDITVVDDTIITCEAPPGPSWKLVDVRLANTNGDALLNDGFGYMRQGLLAAEGRGGVDGQLYYIDPTTGEDEAIGGIDVPITGLAANSTGDVFGVTSNGNGVAAGIARDLVRIDPFTGSAETVGPLVDSLSGNLVKIADIAFIGSTLYGWSRTSSDLVEIETDSGLVTVISDAGFGSFGGGLEADLSGVLYLAPEGMSGNLMTMDEMTGQSTASVAMTDAAGDDVNSMAFVDDGLYGVREGTSGDEGTRATFLIQIDPSDGTVTEVSEIPFGTDAIARTPPVPFL